MDELKACRCGNKDISFTIFRGGLQLVWCEDCGLAVVGESLCDGRKKWNKRPTDPRLIEVVDWIIKCRSQQRKERDKYTFKSNPGKWNLKGVMIGTLNGILDTIYKYFPEIRRG